MMALHRTRLTTIAVVALLVVALALPTFAFAGPGTTGGYGGAQTAGSGSGSLAGGANLQTRVEEALQRRARRFEAASELMERRRERVMELAGVVEKAGGDVDVVRERLAECERLMEQAREQERLAAEMFRGVPEAGDRRGAFLQARVQARNAIQTLNQARTQLREAAQLLHDVADGLQESDDA